MTISKTEQILSLLSGNLSLSASAALRTDLEASAEGRELLAEYEALAAFLAAEGDTEPSVESVSRARRLLKDDRPGLVERAAGAVRTFVASLDFDSRFSELAGFRGGVAEVIQVAFSAEPCELDIEMQLCEAADSYALRGQVAADDAMGWSVRFRNNDTQDISPVIEADVSGSFKAELILGSYTILLEREGVAVEAGPLQVP